jgi:hypothetical protein
MRYSVVSLLAVASGALFGEHQGTQPIKTTVCELVSDPETLNHKLVEIRSEFISRFQWEGFVDETCSAKIQVSPYGVFDDLRVQDGQTHLPVHPKQDHNYRLFREYADTKFKWPDGGRCQDCPLYRIVVTAVGRFDYFAGQTVAGRASPVKKAGGTSSDDLPLLRFALRSVSDTTTTAIDPSSYSIRRRDVTLEEAHGLVKAFQKDHREGGYALEAYQVKEYPGFQFFQALPDPQRSPIHYAIDLATAEAWDAPGCQKLTSPSLEKLQNAIRNRVGLTTDEVRKIGRWGPFCEE